MWAWDVKLLLLLEVPASGRLNEPFLTEKLTREVLRPPTEAAVTLTLGEVLALFPALPAILAGADGTALGGIPSLVEAGLSDVAQVHSGRPNTGANFAVLINIQMMHIPITGDFVIGCGWICIDPVLVDVDLVEFLKLCDEASVSLVELARCTAPSLEDSVDVEEDVIVAAEPQQLDHVVVVAKVAASHNARDQCHTGLASPHGEALVFIVEASIHQELDGAISRFPIAVVDVAVAPLGVRNESVLQASVESVSLEHDLHGDLVELGDELWG